MKQLAQRTKKKKLALAIVLKTLWTGFMACIKNSATVTKLVPTNENQARLAFGPP